jgi:uncharacterized protein (TIGR03437 family)
MRFLLAVGLLCASAALGQTVRFRTTQGDIDITLLPTSAPRTVANFLSYVNKGAYNGTFFHRLVKGFVAQGGGFRWQDTGWVAIPEDPPIVNEYNVTNTRGTIAMAKLGSGPNTATSQWFFNLANNTTTLGPTNNGGFTVFGRINSTAGLNVLTQIEAAQIVDRGDAFAELPVVDYTSGDIGEKNLIRVIEVAVLQMPTIATRGVVTASNFGGFAQAAPGSYIEIYGSNLGPETARQWEGKDFNGASAPTTLDNVRVLVNGTPAYVSYVSAGQINAQIPAGIPTGGPAQIVVSNDGITSAPVQVSIQSVVPGLLAPAAFKVGETQFVVAVKQNGALVSNGTIPGIAEAWAAPGEVLTFYGTGFGPLTPDNGMQSGQIAQGQTRISATVEFKIGGQVAEVLYAGLAPGLVGVYQFNVKVPEGLSGNQEFSITVNGDPPRQALTLPVR